MEDFMQEIDRRANLALTNQMEMLTFSLSDQQKYGVNVFKIIEVIQTPKEVTKIPNAHEAVVGALNFRDRLVTAIDLAYALGLTPVDLNQLSYTIVCEYSGSIQGLLISEPDKLVNKSWDDIKAPTSNMHHAAYLTALTFDGDVAIQILDIEKILGEIIGVEEEIPEDILIEIQKFHPENHHILVIDDSKAARQLLKNALDSLGFKSSFESNAANAFLSLKNAFSASETPPIHLIISDIEMPGMDGFTFTRKVKENKQLKHLPIILHSSMSNPSNRMKAEQVGANDFVAKFHSHDIASVILKWVKRIAEGKV
ncbi:chemotaxis protein [Magnetococcales bacterium HHB-1]